MNHLAALEIDPNNENNSNRIGVFAHFGYMYRRRLFIRFVCVYLCSVSLFSSSHVHVVVLCVFVRFIEFEFDQTNKKSALGIDKFGSLVEQDYVRRLVRCFAHPVRCVFFCFLETRLHYNSQWAVCCLHMCTTERNGFRISVLLCLFVFASPHSRVCKLCCVYAREGHAHVSAKY